MKDTLNSRSKAPLKALVERYVAESHPVGSRALSRHSGLDLSPATARNVMADLEDLELVACDKPETGRY